MHTDAFWLWHTANAHDTPAADRTPGTGAMPGVVLDYVRWDVPGGLVPGVKSQGSLARLRLDPDPDRASHDTLVDRNMEFPRIDDRVITGTHQVIATSLKTGPHSLPNGDADTLAWYDTGTGTFTMWPAGDLAVGEQAFIPRPGDPDPTHGWWTTIATDRTNLSAGRAAGDGCRRRAAGDGRDDERRCRGGVRAEGPAHRLGPVFGTAPSTGR